jgi:hypothetical protein
LATGDPGLWRVTAGGARTGLGLGPIPCPVSIGVDTLSARIDCRTCKLQSPWTWHALEEGRRSGFDSREVQGRRSLDAGFDSPAALTPSQPDCPKPLRRPGDTVESAKLVGETAIGETATDEVAAGTLASAIDR